ncbi:hypothetical protein KEK_15388 [Mycolicibacterium thermoresistibile ATCC 19527]|uniref:Uncharacterized protein n=1 Tax=Mycolicibacterium thermoresistibile (strain ATCC 19527 / DSM 44167 / CIP 105390 / JCM 6362 / NCTC 10409 / 316) TaxID=1078020 RepID=G7CHI5_MYCT3|nr:hypothetical protein KEK_15388 [Mycolicibacterium thermoresistibile ATCC 19527]
MPEHLGYGEAGLFGGAGATAFLQPWDQTRTDADSDGQCE